MKKGYSIRNIPNTPAHRALFKSLADSCGLLYTPRGRGVPAGKKWADVPYGTPLREAPKFTAYYGRSPYVYFEFTGRWQDGRPVLRTLRAPS